MSGWEHHRQETGIPINMRSIAQNGNGRAIGVTPVYPRGENIRPNYNLPQGVLPSQGVQRAVSGPSVYGSAPNRFPAYFTAPGVEMRPHYPPCFPSRGTYLIPGKQRGQLHQRFSHSPTTRGNSDVSSNTHNTPTYGIVPPRPLRMQNNQYPCAPAGQLYLHEQVVAPIPSVQPALLANHDSLSTECVTKMGKLDVLHLQPVAVSAGENGFQPAGGVSISESDISFVISCRHRDKDVEEVTVVIIAMHIVKIAYIRGVGVKNYLALLLTDIGRLELYDLLQIRDHYRNWDLIFYVNFDPRLEKQVRDRLGEFYGSKVNDVDQCELKTMPDLSWNIVRVLRYAHFLDILAKESEESSKNNSVSQGPSSIQRCIETTGLTAEGDVDLNRDETQANAGDTPPATIYHTTQQAPSTSREESVSEDNNNNFPAGGISTRARIQSSSSWNAFGQFGNEEKPYIIRDGDTSSINHASSVKPFENYGTAGEFLASFSGLDDTNDFPVDFLEEEKNLEIPDKGDVKIQEELLTVEDGDNADVVMKSGESLKFVGGVSVGLDVARENLYDGALMNGDMASFFIVHYIPHALLPSNWSKRNKVYFANSDLYPMVSRKCRNSLLQGEEMTAEKVKELFLSRKGAIPSYLQKLMEAELSVIPIFWENHWSKLFLSAESLILLII
ncbi:unnamed protein product [Haemonchus placei]|uniref:ULP_PROTEASE domain-containing protein n=1 Tax=Haemonchus placei TaxID=6290 RepID=A0A158QKJ1_HAEPC|nr:unnamed protein product [Haemonchus placei]